MAFSSRVGRRSWTRDLSAGGLLCVIVALGAAWGHGRLSPDTWRAPVVYGRDALFVLASFKAAGDGHIVPVRRLEVPELNAPFGARWDDFMRQHKPQLWLTGGLVHALGLLPATNLGGGMSGVSSVRQAPTPETRPPCASP